MYIYEVYIYEIYTRYNDVIIMHKKCIYRITTSILNALIYKKKERTLKLYIIYEIFNIIIKSNFFYFLYIKIFINKV